MGKKDNSKLVPKLRFPEFRGTEGWENERMEELYSFMRNNTLPRDKLNYESGMVKNIHYGDIHTKFSTLLVISEEQVPYINSTEDLSEIDSADFCREGDIILADSSEDMEDVGKSIEIFKLKDEQVLSGQHTILARQKAKTLIVGFGGYLFQSRHIRAQIQKEAQGTKVYAVSASRLANISIAFPHTSTEQQKIADCLSSLDELITAQGRKVETLKEHKRGLLQELFPREGEKVPRLRFPEFRDGAEWEEAKISTLIDLVSGLHLSPNEYGISGDVPYFTGPSDFTNDICCVIKWTKSSINTGVAHDTLITVKGSGVGQIFYLELSCVALGRQLMAIRTKKGSSRFIYQWLLSKRSRFEDLASGNLIPGLARGDILDLVVLIPNEDEQRRIASCLSSLDSLIAAETSKLEALKTHKKGLMQQLFPVIEEASGRRAEAPARAR